MKIESVTRRRLQRYNSFFDAVVRCLKTMFLIKKRPLEKKQTTTLCEIGEANSTRPG